MRIMEIAFALMVFNLAMGLLNVAIQIDPTLNPLLGSTLVGEDITTMNSTVSGFINDMQDIGEKMNRQANIIDAVFNWLNIAYLGGILAVTVIWSLISSTVLGFYTLGQLIFCSFGEGIGCSMGSRIFGILQIIVWVIYGIGISQWLSQRSYKEYQ